MQPSKVIKSILKKNKNYTTENSHHNSIPRQTVHNASQGIRTALKGEDKFSSKNKLIQNNNSDSQPLSNGNVKKVHLNSDQDICINDNNVEIEHEQFNKTLQNGIASKANQHLQTVQVDIH